MRALTVRPGAAGSLQVEDLPDPEPRPDELLVEGLVVGICATDREVIHGHHGVLPPGWDRIVVGHESLGRVLSAPAESTFGVGDLVVGVVRRPDPEPCPACAMGEPDMCRNGQYTEHGISGLHGFASERWTVTPEYCVPVDKSLGRMGVLVEPASVAAKVWEQVTAVGSRSWFDPTTVLVTGAGPVGLLIALAGTQRGLDVHVLDRVDGGPKPSLVRALGATYHRGDTASVLASIRPDVVVEATGSAPVVAGVLTSSAPFRVTCLAGLPHTGDGLPLLHASSVREMVLGNAAVFGSINANVRHYSLAASILAKADPSWLDGLIGRRVPLARADEAFRPQESDVKVVIDLD